MSERIEFEKEISVSKARSPQGNLAADCIRNKRKRGFVLILSLFYMDSDDHISVRTYVNLSYGCNRLLELEFHRREGSLGSQSRQPRETQAMDEDVSFLPSFSSLLSPIDVEVVVWWFIVNMPNQSRHFFFLFALSLDNQFKFSRSLAEVVVSFSLFAPPPPPSPLRMINSPSLSLSLFPVETPFFSLSLGLCSFTCSVALSFRLFAIINRGPVILLALGTRCLSFSFSLSLSRSVGLESFPILSACCHHHIWEKTTLSKWRTR